MKPPQEYASATAFRVALESRLKRLAQEDGLDLQRPRRQVAFDRLLCRLFAGVGVLWLLKGGYMWPQAAHQRCWVRKLEMPWAK